VKAAWPIRVMASPTNRLCDGWTKACRRSIINVCSQAPAALPAPQRASLVLTANPGGPLPPAEGEAGIARGNALRRRMAAS
jgi:hypothetical protein